MNHVQTHSQTRSQTRSRTSSPMPVNYHLKIIDSQKILGAGVCRGDDARRISP